MQVVVYDGAGSVVFDNPMGFSPTAEPIRVPVAPGQYRVLISAPGYATQTISMMSPSQKTIPLTPGGTLLIHSSSSSLMRGRLIASSGAVYSRPFDREGVFGIAGATTQVSNVQADNYKLEVLGTNGSVTKTIDVRITDGGVTNVDI